MAEVPKDKKRTRFDVEEWYEYLKPQTFETTIIPFTYREAQAVHHLTDDFKHKVNEKLTEEDKEVIQQLEVKITKAMEKWDGAFIRLSKRSPKDAALLDARLLGCVEEEVKSLIADNAVYAKSKPNAYIIATMRALTNLLKIKNGKEGIDTLVRSQKRIFPDLTLLLLSLDEKDWHENIILREFISLKPEMEFRGFVHNNTINAITQYNSLCFVPYIAENKAALADLLVNYFNNSVKPLMAPTGETSYVVDFAFLNDGTLKVIELNPMTEASHACLFDWGKDRAIMENGPFEFRIVTKPVKNAYDRLTPEIKSFFEKKFPELVNTKDKDKSCSVM